MTLDSITDNEFFNLISNEEKTIDLTQDLNIIKQNRMCCDRVTTMRQSKDCKNKGYYFRCRNPQCRNEVSIKKDSFFENSKLTFVQELSLIYYFVSGNTKLEFLKKQCKIKQDATIVKKLKTLQDFV